MKGKEKHQLAGSAAHASSTQGYGFNGPYLANCGHCGGKDDEKDLFRPTP